MPVTKRGPGRPATHGLSKTRAYQAWRNMMKRCYTKNYRWYHRYGGRGITVCERWHVFENFWADMGECPHGLTLERIKNWLGYSKENCCWATPKEQARNRHTSHYMWVDGVRMTIAEVAEKTGIKAATLCARLSRGMSDHDAVETPLNFRNRPLTANGETMLLEAWASRLGIKAGTIAKRIELGWSVQDAVTKPVRQCRSRKTQSGGD